MLSRKKLPGNIQARKNRHGVITSYQARIDDPYLKTDAGNTVTHTMSFDTYVEAETWLSARKAELGYTGSIKDSRQERTLKEFCEGWLAKLPFEGDDDAGGVRAGSLSLYRRNLERYVFRVGPKQKTQEKQDQVDRELRRALARVPDIGKQTIPQITAKNLKNWALELTKVKGRGLAKRVLRDVKAVLAYAAVDLNLPNVWRDVKLKKSRHADRGVVIVLQTEQASAIMLGALQLRDRGFIVDPDGQQVVLDEEKALPERLRKSSAGKRRAAWARWAPLTWLLFRAGLRIGEGLALVWSDVDWNGRRIRVERTVSDSGKAIEATKTANGQRWIELDAETMTVMCDYRRWCEAPRSKREPCQRRLTDDEAYIFGTNGGERWDNQQNFRRAWDTLLAMLGLLHEDGKSWASPHDARHWHASFLFGEGVPLVDVSARLGHATTTITAEIYVHVLGNRAARDREAADRFDTLPRIAPGR